MENLEKIPHPKVNPYEADRKRTRWEFYDYSQSGTYYVTLCTLDRVCYFGEMENGDLTYFNAGSLAEAFLHIMSVFNPKVEVLNYVVMPDHIHILLRILNDEADLRIFEEARNTDNASHQESNYRDTLSGVIGYYKSTISRACHRQHIAMAWQKSFYDRVIRNPEEMEAINKYINENRVHWGIERTVNPMGWPL